MANAVEKQNIIYNKKSPHYKNRDRQNDAWMCVAEEVGLTMAEAKKMWHNMLAKYRSYRSKVRQSM